MLLVLHPFQPKDTTMASQVIFWNLETSRKMPYHLRMKKLLKTAGWGKHIDSGNLIALKMHFGEAGTTGFIAPLLVAPLVEFMRKAGGLPFLTDTNTLYTGERGESVSHHLRAEKHGFTPHVTGAPVLIADGLKSNNEREVPCAGKHFSSCFLAGDIVDADMLVTLNHFKGHDLAGFGGAIKNLGMGCATRKGKMQQHCGMGPQVNTDHCTGCKACVAVCQPGALSMGENGKVTLDAEKCVGCAACLAACRHKGLTVNWQVEVRVFLERMAEYAAAVVASHEKPCLHISFITHVSPGCDCTGFSDAPICPDLGVAVSYDPVALDQACLDLVNEAPCLQPSRLPAHTLPGEDKFAALHPQADATHLLEYAQGLGMGSRQYELMRI
jgi:hypothetical protein